MTEADFIAQLDQEFGVEFIPKTNLAITTPQERYSAEGAMANIGPSAAQYGSDLMTVFTDPQLMVEGVKLMFTGEGLDALKGFYDERYGSPYSALRTAYTDPVGFLSDVSLVGLPVNVLGKLTNLAATSAKMPKVAGGAEVVRKIGDVAEGVDPVSAAVTGGLGALSNIPGIRSFPESEYETGLKMGTSPHTRMGDRRVRSEVIDTLLQEQVPLTPEGLVKLTKVIDTNTDELERLVNVAEQSGKMIPINDVLIPLKALHKQLSDPKTNPLATNHAAVIEDYATSWLSDLGPVRELTPNQVLELRRNLDRQINWNSVPTVEPPIAKQITEEVASGAREALRETVDDYAPTGRNISKLLTAEEALTRAVNRLSQNQTIGLKQTIGTAAGASVALTGESLEQLAGLLIAGGSLLASPANKQRVARLIYQHRGLSNDQKRTLLGIVASQAGPTAQRIEEGRE